MKIFANFAPLRRGPFARYISGEAISMVGTWMQMSAQGWVLTTISQKAIVLGGQYFLTGLPMILLSLTGGDVADRFSRRNILHLALLVQMLSAAGMGLLIASQHVEIWQIYAVGVLLGVVAAFEVPAVSAFVPELVPREEMSQAIAIDRSVFHATRLIGPALGGFLVGHYGEATAYFANAASYLALIIALWTIPRLPPAAAREETSQPGASVLAGWRFVWNDEPSRAMVLSIAAMTTFVSPFLVITMPYYARHLLHLEAGPMGVLMGASGIGSLVGSLGLLAIPHGHRALALKIGAVATVVAMAGLATSHSFGFSVASLILLTLGLSTGFGIGNIVIQERAPDDLRGRVSAVAAFSFFGLLPFSGLAITWVIDHVGMREAITSCTVAYAVATAFVLVGRKHLTTTTPVA